MNSVLSPLAERLQSLTMGYVIEAQGLRVTAPLTFDQWAELGRAIVTRIEGSTWALGDWLIEGGREGRNWFGGSTYQRAATITGYSQSTLSNAYQTGLAFPRDSRFPTLCWSVHRSARRLPPDQRMAALQQAAFEGWTEQEMSRHVDRLEAAARPAAAPVEPSSRSKVPRSYYASPRVRCPQCGHEFPIKGHKIAAAPPAPTPAAEPPGDRPWKFRGA